jgi:hypothetical protein
MKYPNRSTIDRAYLRLVAALARWLPQPLRVAYIRNARRLPKAFVLGLAMTACGLMTLTIANLALELWSLQKATNGVWSEGLYGEALHLEGVVFQGLAMASMLTLLGAYATLGLKHVFEPSIKRRRLMLRYFATAMVNAAVVFALIPVNAISGAVVDQAMRHENGEWQIAHQWTRVGPVTAARILNDERNGVWYVTDADGPIARQLKTELREGMRTPREALLAGLRIQANWGSGTRRQFE